MSGHLYATIRDLGAQVRADAAEQSERVAMQALAEARAELIKAGVIV